MKKWFALLLVFVLMLPTILIHAQASEMGEFESGDWKYTLLEDGTADITFYWNSSATSVEIPEELDGHPVTISDVDPFWNCNALSSFTVSPNHPNLAVIDGVLFNMTEKKLIARPRASAMTSYTVPEGILAIGGSAFSDCKTLTTITLPESLVSIGDGAFMGCVSLTSFVLPEGLTSIGNNVFNSCSGLTTVTIPEGVTSIGDSSFYACESLTSVDLPKSITSISDCAFSWCNSLTEIVLPEGVASIGYYAFAYCGSLTEITLPESVTNIGMDAFGYCPFLKSITVTPNSYAEQYCKDNDLPIAYIENTDWLNG